MQIAHRKFAGLVLALALAVATGRLDSQPSWLGAPESVAPGIEFYTSTDRSLVGGEGPIAVYLLRLDPARVRLTSVLSNDEVAGAEPVLSIAERHYALAAINAGFFNVSTGEPVGVLRVGGELVSDTTIARGAVAIRSPERGRTTLAFDQITARVALRFASGRTTSRVAVDGVDTTRERGKLMMYTPAYHADTDTAPNGTEWVLRGTPLEVTEVRRDAGRTPIPRDGIVLSYGGLELPASLQALTRGRRVDVEIAYRTLNGLDVALLRAADHVVGGAGLLRVRQRVLTDWTVEHFSGSAFVVTRHPRTLIGVDRAGMIWLAAIDGRQPEHSIGMTFAELQRLADRLALDDALNLDGGGSTTMVIGERIVNNPSDAAGPRPVSDALLVTAR